MPRFVHQADPRQFEAAVVHGDPTKIVKKGVPVLDVHDRLAGFRQHRMEPVQASYAFFGIFPLGNLQTQVLNSICQFRRPLRNPVFELLVQLFQRLLAAQDLLVLLCGEFICGEEQVDDLRLRGVYRIALAAIFESDLSRALILVAGMIPLQGGADP